MMAEDANPRPLDGDARAAAVRERRVTAAVRQAALQAALSAGCGRAAAQSLAQNHIDISRLSHMLRHARAKAGSNASRALHGALNPFSAPDHEGDGDDRASFELPPVEALEKWQQRLAKRPGEPGSLPTLSYAAARQQVRNREAAARTAAAAAKRKAALEAAAKRAREAQDQADEAALWGALEQQSASAEHLSQQRREQKLKYE